MQFDNLLNLIPSNCFTSSARSNLVLQFFYFLDAGKQYFFVELGGQFCKRQTKV